MRPRLALASALLIGTTACGVSGPSTATGSGVAVAGSSDSVEIEIGTGDPLAEPDDPVAPARVATTAAPATAIVVDAGSTPATAAPRSPSDPAGNPATAGQASSSTGSVTAARSSVVAQAVVPRIVARSEPSDDAAPVASLDHPTAVGSPLVFLAVDGSARVGWLQVRLPVQPNGTTGWVRRDEVTLFENPYRIEIDRAHHRLQVFHLGEPWLETSIAVGTGATPTPVGDFYLLELLAPPDPTGPYGPYAFGLSGFSEVLDSFGGADTAIIGLHGTDQPEMIGTDVSFGCIRLANEVMEQLAATLPLGTPVSIT